MGQASGRTHGLVRYDGGSARIAGMLDVAEAQRRAAGLCRQLDLAADATFDVMRCVADLSQEMIRERGQCLLSLRGLSGDGRRCLVITSEYWSAETQPDQQPRRLEKLLAGMDEIDVSPGEPSRLIALKWAEDAGAGHARTHRGAAH